MPTSRIANTATTRPVAPTSPAHSRGGGETGHSSTDAMLEAIGALGRYVVRRRIGAGGMGTVLAAYDPELDRRVAIKIVHGTGDDQAFGSTGAQLRREAQSLARLSHPNVVGVHDAGVHGNFVYIVMEHVDGADLRAWARDAARPWSARLEVLIGAAAGLVAAHASGIVHCDVKPENILVGDDRRVRVADFGLARLRQAIELGADSRSSERFGTPAYMAPESLLHGTRSTAADQYAYCVMAIELLTGVRPSYGHTLRAEAFAPKGLTRRQRTVLDVFHRGLAKDPAQRHASMDALLSLIRWRGGRRGMMRAVAGVVAGVAVGFGFAVATRTRDVDCREIADALGVQWTANAPAIEASMTATSDPLARDAWGRVDKELSSYTARWAELRFATCTAERATTMLDERLPRRRACLELRRDAAASWIDLLAAGGDDATSELATGGLELPSLDACENVPSLLQLPPSPAQPWIAAIVAAHRRGLADASALRHAGRLDEALVVIERIEDVAARLGYLPLGAETALERGRLHRARGETTDIPIAIHRAIALAERSLHVNVRVEGWIELAAFHGLDRRDLTGAPAWLDVADTALDAIGRPPDLTTRLALIRGRVLLDGDQFEEACAVFDDLVDAPTSVVEPDIVAHELGSCYMVLNRWNEAMSWLTRALELREQRFGPLHPAVIDTLGAIGRVYARSERPNQAERPLQRALWTVRTLYPERRIQLARLLASHGGALLRRGELAAARRELEEALTIVERDDAATVLDDVAVRANLGAVYSRLGLHDRAREMLMAALERTTAELGPTHSRNSIAMINLAHATARTGEFAAAAAWMVRASEVALQPSRRQLRASLLGQAARWEWQAGNWEAAHRRLSDSFALSDQSAAAQHSRTRWIADHPLPVRDAE